MKTLDFEQMEQISGGSTYGWVCGGLFTGWGVVLSIGAMTMGPVGVAVGAGWAGVGYVVCNL